MIKTILIGTGGFARYIMKSMYKRSDTEIIGFVEPSEKAREATRKHVLEECGAKTCPESYDDLPSLLEACEKPDVAYIITPHKFHIEHIRACLEAGINVLVEKPMVLNEVEAREVIKLRDATGLLVVVGFPGSLSPAMAKAKEVLAAGTIGPVQAVSGTLYQGWARGTKGTWRQNEELSGGGFLFDTGSHMLNTMVDLMQNDLKRIFALLDNRGYPVEINSSITGEFQNGVQISLAAIGDGFACRGALRLVGQEGILEIGMWGEYLKLHKPDHSVEDVPYGEPKSTWDNFCDVYYGEKENPCPPEVGLRFAQLMDMIRASAREKRLVER